MPRAAAPNFEPFYSAGSRNEPRVKWRVTCRYHKLLSLRKWNINKPYENAPAPATPAAPAAPAALLLAMVAAVMRFAVLPAVRRSMARIVMLRSAAAAMTHSPTTCQGRDTRLSCYGKRPSTALAVRSWHCSSQNHEANGYHGCFYNG